MSYIDRFNTGGARSALGILFQCICKLFHRKCDVRTLIYELQNFGILLWTVIDYIAFCTCENIAHIEFYSQGFLPKILAIYTIKIRDLFLLVN